MEEASWKPEQGCAGPQEENCLERQNTEKSAAADERVGSEQPGPGTAGIGREQGPEQVVALTEPPAEPWAHCPGSTGAGAGAVRTEAAGGAVEAVEGAVEAAGGAVAEAFVAVADIGSSQGGVAGAGPAAAVDRIAGGAGAGSPSVSGGCFG